MCLIAEENWQWLLQQAASFVSPTVTDCCCFTADMLWICVNFGHGKSMLKKRGHPDCNCDHILYLFKIKRDTRWKVQFFHTTTYLVWAYYAHGRQHRCWEDPVSPSLTDWRRQPGRPHITWLSTVQQNLKQHHLTLPEAADLAQNRPLWRMMSTYDATQSYRVACQKRRRQHSFNQPLEKNGFEDFCSVSFYDNWASGCKLIL